MSPYECEDCGAPVDESDRVDAELIYISPVRRERVGRYCAACAKVFARKRTVGQPNEHLLGMAAELIWAESPHPMHIQWIQSGEPRRFLVLVLVRRATDRDLAEPQEIPPDPDAAGTTLAVITKGRTE
jgi:hypothetical protein